MQFSKRIQYILLGFLVVFNIILRLPVTPHGFGDDSFYIQTLANSISSNGYAIWILNPLSFFGLYEFSYPSGEIFFLSGVSQIIGVDLEWTIWIISIFVGIIGIFTAYLMAIEMKNDFLFAFSVSFVFSTSQIFIDFTNWSVSARGFFIAVLPLFLWSLLKFYNEKGNRTKYLLLSISIVIILGTIHRMVFFIPIILIAFFSSYFIYHFGNRLINIKIGPKTTAFGFFIIFIILFILPFTSLDYNYEVTNQMTSGNLNEYYFEGSSIFYVILNMGIWYAIKIGLLALLIPLGFITILYKKDKTFSDVFLLATILCFTPFLANKYLMFFGLFMLSLLIGFGLMEIHKKFSNMNEISVSSLILIAIILFSSLLPYLIVIRQDTSLPMHTVYMNELTNNAAQFIRTYDIGNPRISDASSQIQRRIDANAGPPYYHEDIENFDFSKIKRVPFSKFLNGHYDYLYANEEEKKWGDYLSWNWNCDNEDSRRVLNNKTYLVIKDNYRPKDLAFYQCLRNSKPKIYDNSLESIWYLSYN